MEYPDSTKKQRVTDILCEADVAEDRPLMRNSEDSAQAEDIIDVAHLFSDDPSGSSSPPSSTHLPPCKYFQAGHCSSGPACRFAHVKIEAAPSSHVPCVFFAKGKCTEGDRCRFSHTEKQKASAVSLQMKHSSGPEEPPVCRYESYY